MSNGNVEVLSDGEIRTYTGRIISPLSPNPDDISIDDIAHALSLNCRFTGHVRWHYSVAQHSVLVASLVEDGLRLTALLHDASEAYLSDIARPIKHQPEFGDVYLKYEERLERAIAERFGLEYPWPRDIKLADTLALATEMRDLMDSPEGDYPVEPLEYVTIKQWSPEQAEDEFLATYYRLKDLDVRKTPAQSYAGGTA